MSKIKLVSISLQLDLRTLGYTPWSIFQRVEFIFKKYILIISHLLGKKFVLGQSKVNLKNEMLYYDSNLGLDTYQSMITRHNRLIDSAGIDDLNLVIDCGANVGFYSKFISSKFQNISKIYAFEPVPRVFACLEENLKNDPKCLAVNKAISSQSKKLKMKFDSSNSVTSKVSPKGDVAVEAVSLEEFCRENEIRNVDLLKIDTEGYEIEVLKGAQKVLPFVKYLVIELNFREQDYSIARLMSLLIGDRFDFQIVSFRNFSGKAEGKIDVMDCLLVNRRLI